jgi:hypothetical protein
VVYSRLTIHIRQWLLEAQAVHLSISLQLAECTPRSPFYNLRASAHVHLSLSLQPLEMTPSSLCTFSTHCGNHQSLPRGGGGEGGMGITVWVDACSRAGRRTFTHGFLRRPLELRSVREAHRCTKAETPLCFTGSLKSLARRNVDPQR